MLTYSHLARRHRHHLEEQNSDQNPDDHFLHENQVVGWNGRLRIAILKNNLIDSLSRWLARQLPRQVILFATIQLWAAATTGPYASEDNEITMPQAIARWQRREIKQV